MTDLQPDIDNIDHREIRDTNRIVYAKVANDESDGETEDDRGDGRHSVKQRHQRHMAEMERWSGCGILLTALISLAVLITVTVIVWLWYTNRLPRLHLAALYALIRPSSPFDDTSLPSSRRGHIALVYSGTMRTFSSCFHSHLINVIAPSPYTVHLFMHADVVSPAELNTFHATLDYYSGWYDIDNNYVPTRSAIKAMRFDPRTDLSVIAAMYDRELAVIGTDWRDTEPTRVLAQLEGNRMGNELRMQYEKATGVEYTHVLRMRWDMTFKTPIWSTLFHIEPRINMQPPLIADGPGHVAERWQPVVNRTYVLYDMTYTYRVDSAQLIVPACDWYNGGYNDQFSISNSSIMTLLSNRGHDSAVFATNTKASPWAFHAESFFRRVMEFHGVPSPVLADQCHSKLEYNGEACGVNGYGKDCCSRYCPVWRSKERRLIEQLRPFQTLASYVQHLPPAWELTVDSSSFQSYWRHRRPEYSVACLLDEEQKKQPLPNMLPQPNPYFHLQLPYIVRQQSQLRRFLAHDLCPPS